MQVFLHSLFIILISTELKCFSPKRHFWLSLDTVRETTAESGKTYVGCWDQRVGQHANVIVSVEPWHEQHTESHVYQKRHQDVGFPEKGQKSFF